MAISGDEFESIISKLLIFTVEYGGYVTLFERLGFILKDTHTLNQTIEITNSIFKKLKLQAKNPGIITAFNNLEILLEESKKHNTAFNNNMKIFSDDFEKLIKGIFKSLSGSIKDIHNKLKDLT